MIKKLASALFIFGLLCSQAIANEGILSSYRFGVPCEVTPLTITDEGNGFNASSGATLSTGATIDAAVGDTLVTFVASDNAGSGGAVSLTGLSATGGNSWTERAKINWDPGAASAGATLGIYTTSVTSALSSATITANFSPNTSARSMQVYRIQGYSGGTISVKAVDTTGVTDNNTAHTAATVSVDNGNTIFGVSAIERDTNTITPDSDTTNGSWSTIINRVGSSGSDATSMTQSSQYKTVNATGNQTWNITTASSLDGAKSYIVFEGCGGIALPSVAFVGNVDSTADATTYTYTAAATGTAGATRVTLIGACGQDNANDFSITGITVDSDGAGGAAPVAAVEVADSAHASANVQCALYSVANPSNTTATIVVTYSEGILCAQISVWAAYDLDSATATDFATGFDSSSNAFSIDTDVQANGIIVGVGTTYGGSDDVWTSMTERTWTVNGEGVLAVNPADGTTTTAQTPRTITYNSSSSNNLAVAVTGAFK